MPSGIILSSASHGATQEAIEDVLSKNGLEVEKTEEAKPEPEVVAEPSRDDFKTEEEFEAAHVEWQDAQEKVEEKDEDDEEEKPTPKKSRMQRKIERATAAKDREIDDLKKRLDTLEKGGKKEEKKEEPNPRPERSKYQSNEEYEDALLAWGVEKALAEKTVKDARNKERIALETNLTSYREQVAEFKEEHDDWDKVVSQDIPMHTGVQLAIMEQDNAAETIYYLGKHPEYTKRLAEMTPLSAVMEVGRLSARLKTGASKTEAANGTDKTKTRPRAPAPPTPISTAATSSTGLTSREIAAKPNYPGKAKDFKRALNAGR